MSVQHYFFFFFNDTATTEIYTLSLHDALPISGSVRRHRSRPRSASPRAGASWCRTREIAVRSCPADRKSTRLNSSHVEISYAVFCLKKKKKKNLSSTQTTTNVMHKEQISVMIQ